MIKEQGGDHDNPDQTGDEYKFRGQGAFAAMRPEMIHGVIIPDEGGLLAFPGDPGTAAKAFQGFLQGRAQGKH